MWTISEQSLPISAVDWTADNKILTCSYDRSVFVHRLDTEKNRFIKDLVLCTNDKSVLTGCWSANGAKFAVGTSCHRTFIGYYDEKNRWW